MPTSNRTPKITICCPIKVNITYINKNEIRNAPPALNNRSVRTIGPATNKPVNIIVARINNIKLPNTTNESYCVMKFIKLNPLLLPLPPLLFKILLSI